MNDGSIKIVIGAAADRSIETVFAGIEKRGQKAASNISKAFSGSFGSGGGGGKSGFDAAVASARKAEREIEREIRRQEAAVRAGYKEISRESDKSARDRVRAEQKANNEIIQEFKRQVRERKSALDAQEREEKAAADKITRDRERSSRMFGRYATRNLFPERFNPISTASRVGQDILRGAGVDFSVAGSVSRAIQMQSGSVQLANQQRIAEGTTIGSGAWNKVSRNIGGKFSTDANAVQDMLLAFTAKTGKFGAAAGIGEELTSLSVASGANLRDMGNAAGYVYNQLQHLPDAGKRTIEVMRGIVGQTAVGAVDMPDYATQLGRIAANASKFEGDKMDNIRQLSALAQLAVESGGASSPADAARSVASFANTFGKHARISAFENIRAPGFEHGIDLFTDKKQNVLRKPIDIIKDAFKATQGNIPILSNLFADTLGRKPVTALGNAFNAAGGGEKGLAAVEASFQKYMKVSLDAATEAQNIKDYQESTAAKAQKFQNSLDMIVNETADHVFPALEKLAPTALKAADALGSVASWTAENPMSAISAAIAASIAQAGLQTVVRSGLEKALANVGGGAGIALTGTVMLTAMAVTLINEDIRSREDEQRKRSTEDSLAGIGEGEIAMRVRKGQYSETDIEYLNAVNANIGERIKRVHALKERESADMSDTTGGGEFGVGSGFGSALFDSKETVATKQDALIISNMEREFSENKQLLDKIRSGLNGELRVRVTNMPGERVEVDPRGRQPPPGNFVMR